MFISFYLNNIYFIYKKIKVYYNLCIGERNMAEIISGIYKIINTITGDFYIGSSKDVKQRLACHKCQSTWNEHPNNPMYLDMQEYGKDKFVFEVLEVVEIDKLKETEQQFIETLKPTYNNYNAKGLNTERHKEHQIEYYQQNREKLIEHKREYYQQNRERYIEHQIEYYQQNREKRKEYQNKYQSQLCSYNGEMLTLTALSTRFKKSGIAHPTKEAKKYLVL